MYPRQESNLDNQLRRLVFYPLNYEGKEDVFFGVGYAGFEPATVCLRGNCSTN